MHLSDNLEVNYSDSYLPYISINRIDDYKFTIKILNELDDNTLYTIIYSYLKNKNLVICKVYAMKQHLLGIEYINLINTTKLSYYEFILFKKRNLSDMGGYTDSHFNFFNNVNPQSPLTIEISTFNKHNICKYTKPRLLE